MNMTFNLLKKEIKLNYNVSTTMWIICAFFMFFIPSYPMYIGPFYITLAIMMVFALGPVSNDILYSVLLPVRKRDTVKARFLYCLMFELLSFAFSLIAIVIRHFLHYSPNKAGIDLNVAYYGLQLIIYSVFNTIFFFTIYKNPVKPGLKYIIASLAYFAVYFLCELPVWNYAGMVEGLKKGGYDLSWAIPDALSKKPKFSLERIGSFLYARDFSTQIKQLPILAIGLVLYAGTFLLAYKKAVKQFEEYDV